MKKFSFAILCALLGASCCLSSCGDDNDDKKSDDVACSTEKPCENADQYCNANSECVDKLADDAECADANQCKSGACNDGKCGAAKADDCKCDDGSACPDGDKNKCTSKAEDCKCDDGSDCPDGDKTKCTSKAEDCKCDDGSDCPDGDKNKCEGAAEECKCDDGSNCPDGDKAKCTPASTEPLANGEVCNDNNECKSGYCETVDDETRKCADKPEDDPKPDGKACTDDSKCDASKGERCIDTVCLTADKLDKTKCSEAETGYCFGNIRVFCNVQESASLYDTQDCKDAECNDNAGKPVCKAKEPADPTKCTAENVDAVVYSCGGDLNEDGSYTKSITKTCTKDGSNYKWVDKEKDCGDDACWSNHASSACLGTYPNDFENGKDCSSNLNCKSDYCDTATKKCADKPE